MRVTCVYVWFFFFIFFRVQPYAIRNTVQHERRIIVHLRIFIYFLFFFLFFFFRFFPFSSSSCKFHSHSHAFSVFSLILFCLYRFAFVNVDRNPSHEIRRKDSMDRATRDQKKISLQVYLDREVRNDGGGKIERDTFSQWRVRKISYIDSLWDWFFNCRSDANRRWLLRYFNTLYFNVYVYIYIDLYI